MKTLSDISKEIKLLMEYAVPKEHTEQAEALLEHYSGDIVALNVFHTFYSYLPEAEDDAITALISLEMKKGAFLICATTLLDSYIYLATSEEALFLGRHAEGVWDEEVLEFFGFKNREAFQKKYKDLSRFKRHVPVNLDEKLCPVCSAADGEHHVLGCPVEICPWCGSQLTSCNCRFKKLGTEKIEDEMLLESLRDQLNRKGRIPYDAKRDRPAYPSDSGPARGIKKE